MLVVIEFLFLLSVLDDGFSVLGIAVGETVIISVYLDKLAIIEILFDVGGPQPLNRGDFVFELGQDILILFGKFLTFQNIYYKLGHVFFNPRVESD